MTNPIKYFEHGELYFVTSRTEDGLPFKEAHLFSEILKSLLARAQLLYPVKLIAFDLEANHLHMLLCALNPEHVPAFVGYIKQELSHIVNRIRGRKKKTIWCDGYDSPVLLGEGEAFHYITYIYNQQRSGRMTYCNSWQMLTSGVYSEQCKRIFRSQFDPDPSPDVSEEAEQEESKDELLTLTIEPFYWVARLASCTEDEAKEQVMKNVLEARSTGKVTPLDPNELKPRTEAQRARDDAYVPKKRGQRSYCICWDIEKRKRYLAFIKNSIAECRAVLEAWRQGDYTAMWPPGFFPPSAVRRANPVFL